MKFFSSRISLLALLPILLLSIAPQALGSKGRENRQVAIASVEGDVRISNGKDYHADLNTPWQEALGGELVVEGTALATGNGRAEVAFENGSTVYLAENSLLLFKELSAPGDRIVSRVALATGTATFSLEPAAKESFAIDTPTVQLELSETEKFFARLDAYLDATAITAEGQKGQRVARRDGRDLQLRQGKTVFFRNGAIIPPPARSTQDEAQGMAAFLLTMPDFQLPALGYLYNRTNEMHPGPENEQTQAASEWDGWVSTRLEQRNTVTAAALRASRLSSPIPGLVDLYEQGRFIDCEPYGTCWEPTEPEAVEENPQPSGALNAQSPSGAQSNPTFQPQTVQWRQFLGGWCNPLQSVTVTRVAHSAEELEKLLAMKNAIEHTPTRFNRYSVVCDNGYWIRSRRHYVRVLTRQQPPPGCARSKCIVRAPRPVWVRVGNRVGFVPPHPNDVKGKPPINLKEGMLIPPSKPGERIERVALGPWQKVTVFDKAPREVPSEPGNPALHVSAPEIHAHLLQEAFPTRSLSLSARAVPQIIYDYKSHQFLTPASAAGGKSKEVPVGGIDSHGKIGSFADGHSGAYTHSFAHSEAVASYRGAYGSTYSGGGHNSGNSSGSYSSGSQRSGSGSYGGGSSHSSGSVASSSSSSSAASSAGGSHGRP